MPLAWRIGFLAVTASLIVCVARAQGNLPWRSVGPTVIEKGLAGAAAGPVDRVWYSPDGLSVFANTRSGRIYGSTDIDRWERLDRRDTSGEGRTHVIPPAIESVAAPPIFPETDVQFRAARADGSILYAFGVFVYRSNDGGRHWDNLTAFRGASLVGESLHDLAISPNDPDEIVVAGDDGIFRSADGGLSWSALNGGFPNLQVARILDLPEGSRGARISLSRVRTVTLPPGEKRAWQPSGNDDLLLEIESVAELEKTLDAKVSAVASAGSFVYAGVDGRRIWTSSDGGLTWRASSIAEAGETVGSGVERFWVDAVDPRIALAVMGGTNAGGPGNDVPVRVLRTSTGGDLWDNITADLPDVPVHGVAVDRASGAVYLASDNGVYMTTLDPGGLGIVSSWILLAGLPFGPVTDVKLDALGNQLWAAVEGSGLYTVLAPHRVRDPRAIGSADWADRALAPGSLVTVLGAGSQDVRAGDLSVPVLASSRTETQIQIPYDIAYRVVTLTVASNGTNVLLPSLPVIPAVPAIFIDRDGSPMILDAESGVMLDADHPLRRGSRVQILTAGLGRVSPEWPAGVPAPPVNEPRVAGAVRVYLDRLPIEVTRATLAPGYVGMYLVEALVPAATNAGPAELFLEVDGAPSNRVRVYIEP